MSRAPSLAPFRMRDGRVRLEDVELAALADELAGRAAFVVSHRALSGALRRAQLAAGGPVVVDVAALGPQELLAVAAHEGCWARARSSHELQLARAAGILSARLVVAAPVLDDGLVRDALLAGVAVLEATGDAALNVRRIAMALGHDVPAVAGAPPALSAGALRRVGGLLAPLLSGPPDLAIDATWTPWGRGRVVAAALQAGEVPGEATLRGLPGRAALAQQLGDLSRGDWALVPDPRAAAPQLPDLAHPMAAVVLVRGGAFRLLEPRPLPAARSV